MVAEVLNCCVCGAREVVEDEWGVGEVDEDMLILGFFRFRAGERRR